MITVNEETLTTNEMRYSILYADPPWDYNCGSMHSGAEGSPTGGAKTHYPTMSMPDLKKLDVPSLAADDALLFMWVTSPHLDQGLKLMSCWQFNYKTIAFVWDKGRVNPGYYTMAQCEICIVGKRGKIPCPRGARNVRQMVHAERQKHSAKPEEVRERIEKMFPTQSKIELFARTKHPGWSAWGNDVTSDVFIENRTVL